MDFRVLGLKVRNTLVQKVASATQACAILVNQTRLQFMTQVFGYFPIFLQLLRGTDFPAQGRFFRVGALAVWPQKKGQFARVDLQQLLF